VRCEKRERELKTKKKWITPQLIVLVKGKPEEGVLANCKVWTTGYALDRVFNNGCMKDVIGGFTCMSCFNIDAS